MGNHFHQPSPREMQIYLRRAHQERSDLIVSWIARFSGALGRRRASSSEDLSHSASTGGNPGRFSPAG